MHLSLVWVVLLLHATPVQAETAHPGQDIETGYAEAVLAYNSRDYRRTLQFLNALLKVQPTNVEALELQALTLKTTGDDKLSLETYKKLTQLKPEKERGPYHFEAGVILYKNQKFDDAKPQLERAIASGFNVTVANFFLGNIAFKTKDRKLAERAFKVVAKDENGAELRVAAHYFLGLIYFQAGLGSTATQELMIAKKEAARLPANKTAQEIGAAAAKALAPFDQSQWFGNVSLITQYDGNVTLANAASLSASGQSSIVERLSAGFGRMSSPLQAFQWVASDRLNYNKNLNAAVKDYEFLANVPSLYLTVNPLAKTNYGWKFEGNYSFKNTVTGTSATFRPYTQSLEMGPYARTSILQRTVLSFETTFRAQKFPQDSSGGPDVRSGNVVAARLAAKRDFSSKYLNPDADIFYELNYARGSNMKNTSLAFGVANQFRVTGKDLFTASIDYTIASYALTIPVRSDTTLSARVAWLRTLGPRWSLISDVSYTKNSSNITTYVYTKPAVTIGLSYSL